MEDLAVALDDLQAVDPHVFAVAGIEAEAVEVVQLRAVGLDLDRRVHQHGGGGVVEGQRGCLGQGHGVFGVALGRAEIGPVAQHLDLLVAEPRVVLVGEGGLAVFGLGRVPGRHGPGLAHVRHQGRPRGGLVVGVHGEGSDAAFGVAGDAVFVHEQGHVFMPVGPQALAGVAVAVSVPAVAVAVAGVAVAGRVLGRGVVPTRERQAKQTRQEARAEDSSGVAGGRLHVHG